MTNSTAPYNDIRDRYIDRDNPKHGKPPMLPDGNGVYTIYIPFVGPMKAIFCDRVFYWENGDVIADSLCRWWK